MATKIKFKRGNTSNVINYESSADIGEPIYDYNTGDLYVKRLDGNLFSVRSIIVDSSDPSSSPVESIGTLHINDNINFLKTKSPVKWEKINTDKGITFQKLLISENIVIPDNEIGISYGPIELSNTSSIEFSVNSIWTIN